MPAATDDTLDVQEVPLDNANSTASALGPVVAAAADETSPVPALASGYARDQARRWPRQGASPTPCSPLA